MSTRPASACRCAAPHSRPGGSIGLANWTPDGFIGQLFKTIGKHNRAEDGTMVAPSEYLEIVVTKR